MSYGRFFTDRNDPEFKLQRKIVTSIEDKSVDTAFERIEAYTELLLKQATETAQQAILKVLHNVTLPKLKQSMLLNKEPINKVLFTLEDIYKRRLIIISDEIAKEKQKQQLTTIQTIQFNC